MTREEAIEDLRYLLDFDDYGSVHSESILLAIKSLEQEPILDKIRDEIEAEPYVSKMEVLDIIDKYKAESEDKE